MCGNARPKLLEVSYWRTSQLSKGLLTMSSPHFTEYRTNSERARHGGFQTLDAEHRTDSRRPLDQHPGTTSTTETDKNGGRRRRRQAKTETDENRLTLGTSELAAPSLTDDDTPE